MASLRDIRIRIESVKNTKKITYAMKLVAAAKLKRAQDAAQRGRTYTEQLNQMVAALVRELGSDGVSSPFLNSKNASGSDKSGGRVLLVIFGGARGLCGGYNSNLNKQIEATVRELSATREVELLVVGKKVGEYLRRTNRDAVKAFEDVSEDATQWPINDVAQFVEERFTSGAVSEVQFLYTKFRSAISMTPTVTKLLPMDPSALVEGNVLAHAENQKGTSAVSSGLTLFEPSPAEVFSELLPRLMRSKLRQGASDAKASETAARMTAMDAATKNAGDLINKLTLLRNKLRQSGITSQLLDIVGGAEAVNG